MDKVVDKDTLFGVFVSKIFRDKNTKPQIFRNVKVYSGSKFHDAAKAVMGNCRFKNLLNGKIYWKENLLNIVKIVIQ